MKVNVISESAFTVQGHGVHTAFTETVDALRNFTDCDVEANVSRPADIVHIHTVGPYALARLLLAKRGKVVSAHVTPDSFVGSLAGAKYWYGLAKWYLTWFYNRADAVLGVSQDVVTELKAMGVRKKVYLVPNTISTEIFRTSIDKRKMARQKLKISENAFVVISNGQVQPRKRIDCFVAAAQELPEIEFIWVGGIPFKNVGAESSGMTKIMKQHPKNVRITGVIDRKDVVDYFFAADLFFLPSAQETFGIVVVEAAAAGLPILLRDLEQYRDTFSEGYERGTDGTFDEQIRRFATDKDYYLQWKKKSHKIAVKYSAEAGAGRLMEVYQDVLAAQDKIQKDRTLV